MTEFIDKLNKAEGLDKYDLLFDKYHEFIKNKDIPSIEELMNIIADNEFDKGVYRTTIVVLKPLYFFTKGTHNFRKRYEEISNKLKQ